MGIRFSKPVLSLPNQMFVLILIHKSCKTLVFLSHSPGPLSIKRRLDDVGRISRVPLQHGYLSRFNLEALLNSMQSCRAAVVL